MDWRRNECLQPSPALAERESGEVRAVRRHRWIRRNAPIQCTALITKRGAMSATDPRAAKGYPLPLAPARGSASAKAESLLHLRKYKEAQDAFEDVIKKILSGELKEADELPL